MSNLNDPPLHVVLTKLQQVCLQAEAARQKIFDATARLAALRSEEMQLLSQANRASGALCTAPDQKKPAKLEERLPGMFVNTMPLDMSATPPSPRSRTSK